MKTHFIKDGYAPRGRAETIEANVGDYWTDVRIRMASFYQHEVYRRAGEILRTNQLKSVLDVGAGYPAKLGLLGNVDITLVDQPTLQERLRTDFPNVEFVADDLENPTSLHDRKFEVVISADVLEHLIDPDPCLDFIREKTSRFAILSTPERDIIRGEDCMASPKAEHVREWNTSEFAAYVKSRGFRILTHELVPQARLFHIEAAVAKRIPIRSKRWSGCQMVVCAPA
jgi:2-polyprenyl-3-methyl-5-hydroxy-6-metoxy-1,4-benzoquinol methylase